MQKKGAEINITTIIVIILALLVLVILALYFTGGMKSLWQRITSTKGAWDQTDIENARQVCATHCSAGNKDFFCTHEFSIRAKDGTTSTLMKCTDPEINAQKMKECKEAGFTKEICIEVE